MDRTIAQHAPCAPPPLTPEYSAALTAAFARFSETSRQLTESYCTLEREASRLRSALRTANRRRASQSRRNADLAQRQSALVEALPGGVLLLDGADQVLAANAAAVGILGEPVIGETWNELRQRAFAATDGDQEDLVLKDSRRITLAQKPLQPAPGRVLLLTDVTDKRRIEDLLSRHRRLANLGEMAAALAHQIRTPLAAGLLYATNARRAELPAEQRDALLAKSIGCLHDLERLIADMLQFARGATLAESRFALNDLLDSVETATRPMLLSDQSLSVTRPAQAVMLTGNRETLAGAILNLTTNALHAGGARADVQVMARVTSLQAEILVTDNGPGIDGALHQRIFEPFFTSRDDGTGLGLSVARSIARAHRGDVILVNGAPGHTTFLLRLPVPAAASNAASPERNVAA